MFLSLVFSAFADSITLDTGAVIEGDLAHYEFGGDCQIGVTEGELTGVVMIVPCHRVASFVRTSVRKPIPIGAPPADVPLASAALVPPAVAAVPPPVAAPLAPPAVAAVPPPVTTPAAPIASPVAPATAARTQAPPPGRLQPSATPSMPMMGDPDDVPMLIAEPFESSPTVEEDLEDPGPPTGNTAPRTIHF